MKKKEIISLVLATENAYIWSSAVLKQIDRVNNNKNAEKYERQIERIADDHFLKISLVHLYNWVEYIERYVTYSEYSKLYETKKFTGFSTILKEKCNIKSYRNMGEHDIDYYAGNGRIQEKFYNDNYNQSKLQPLIGETGEYLLSGEINIDMVRDVVTKIKRQMKNNCFDIKIKTLQLPEKDLLELFDGKIVL